MTIVQRKEIKKGASAKSKINCSLPREVFLEIKPSCYI